MMPVSGNEICARRVRRALLTFAAAALAALAPAAAHADCPIAFDSSTRPENTMIFNEDESTYEYCLNGEWKPFVQIIVDCTVTTDDLPDAFSFTDLVDQDVSTLVYSNTLTITNFDGPLVASVSGAGQPQLQVNGGAWVNAAPINPGNTLRLRQLTSGTVDAAVVATVTIGSGTDDWTVSTESGQMRIFTTPGTWNGAGVGGLEGADAKCQAAANGLAYGGTWRAVISDQYTNARDRLALSYPIVRASSTSTVIESTNLWSSSIENTIGGGGAWTATQSDGDKQNSLSCTNWTSTSGSGEFGDANELADWVNDQGVQACTTSYKLICIEQQATLFDNKSDVPLSTVVYSSTTTVFGAGGAVSISGTGSPEFSINGGGWVTSGSVVAGDTLRLRVTSAGTVSTQRTATVAIGATNFDWDVTTQEWLSRLFRTSGSYQGNLGGLAGADSICQTEAGTLGYGGTWKAIMSSSSTNAAARLTVQYPVAMADDWAIVETTNLWTSSLEGSVGTSARLWTGTTATGVASTATCSDWTTNSNAATGRVGYGVATDGSWVSNNSYTCDLSQPLMCLEQ